MNVTRNLLREEGLKAADVGLFGAEKFISRVVS